MQMQTADAPKRTVGGARFLSKESGRMLLERQRLAHEEDLAENRAASMGLSYQPRVLIAEDNEQTSHQLRLLLEKSLGVSVDVADDGKQALEAVKRNFYSLFLTDLKMP